MFAYKAWPFIHFNQKNVYVYVYDENMLRLCFEEFVLPFIQYFKKNAQNIQILNKRAIIRYVNKKIMAYGISQYYYFFICISQIVLTIDHFMNKRKH